MSQTNITKFVYTLVLLLCIQASVFGICITPYNINTSNTTTNSFTINWSDFSSDAIAYHTVLVPRGTVPTFDVFQEITGTSKMYNTLASGKSYDFYIRTYCETGISNWSNPITFTTHLENQASCNKDLIILDNQCNSPNSYFLKIENIAGQLGESAFIQKINLFVQHSWPSDLTIKLKSPSGKETLLIKDRGIGQSNLGVIDSTCNEPLSFTSAACQMISDPGKPLVGNFQPEEPIEVFYDNSSPNGLWELILCDKAEDQMGTLRGFEILFDEAICSGPSDLYFQDIADTHAKMIIPSAFCDSIQVNYKAHSAGITKTITTHCNGDTLLLEQLSPDESYEINYHILCGEDNTSIECPVTFETSCRPVTLAEDFDDKNLCESNCITECHLSDYWKTDHSFSRWNISKAHTENDLTGPMEDFSGIGNYLYAEATQSDCYKDSTILTSHCMLVNGMSECDFQFKSFMYGADVDSISLLIINDTYPEGKLLWNRSGNQENQWQNHEISLQEFHGTYALFRFIAYFRNGDFGDIALDELTFHGSTSSSQDGFVYYIDQDMDGFGSRTDSIFYCGTNIPTGYSDNYNDCDDLNPNINPNAEELGCNLIDDNCNGEVDEVNDNFVLQYSIDSLSHENCFGSSDGVIQLSASGGVEPYVFQWEDGTESSTRNDLTKGTYQVTISDASGCKAITAPMTINVLQNFPGISFVYDTVSCFGIYDGGIHVVPPSTGAPHTLQWSTNDSGPQISNVTSGMYTLTLTDVNGCNVEINFNLPSRTQLEVSKDSMNRPSCFAGMDGMIAIQTSGGEGPYSYQWANGHNDALLTNIGKGTYAVTSTDVNGCIVQDSFELKQPKPLEFTINEIRSNTCFGSNNGFISVLPKGGTPPYSILWSDQSTDFMNDQLSAGEYHFTLYDKNNCSVQSDTITITEPTKLSLTDSQILPSYCLSDSTGQIALDVTGGSGNYQYFWNNNRMGNPLIDVKSDHYSVTIIDEYNCKLSIDSIHVPNESFKPTLTVIQQNMLLCHEDQNGSILASIDSSISPVISWHINEMTTQSMTREITFDQLSEGIYQIYAQDELLCTSDTVSIELIAPDSLSYSIDSIVQNPCTNAQQGKIALNIQGGTPPYTYQWSHGDTSLIAHNLGAGIYQLTVSDANQCTLVTDSFEIVPIDSLKYNISEIVHNACSGANTGKITIDASGGTPPYQYTWNTNQTGASIDQLVAGIYVCTIKDVNQCTFTTQEIEILEPAPLSYTIEEKLDNLCFGDQKGKITLLISGGSEPYQVTWNNQESTFAISNLQEGHYWATIRDSNDCLLNTDSLYISQPQQITYTIDSVSHNTCFGDMHGKISLSTNGGTAPYQYIWSSQDTTEDITNLSGGEYLCTITDANGCIAMTDPVTITQADSLYFKVDSLSMPLCHGDSNGYIRIKPNGGFGQYNFKWEDGDVSLIKENLAQGVYRFELSDDGDCPAIMDSVTLIQPDKIEVNNLNIKNTICKGKNGAINFETTGGNGIYSYFLNNKNVTKEKLDSLDVGEYSFYIKDQNQCISDTHLVNIELNNLDPLLSLDQIVKTTCSDSSDGIIKVTAFQPNSIPPYKWTLNQIETVTESNKFSNQQLPSGSYILYFEDGYGCIDSLTKLNIYSPSPIKYFVDSLKQNTCHNSFDSYISISSNGGTGAHQYKWSNGEQMSQIESLVDKEYSCTITDENDCQLTTEVFSIAQPDSLYLIAEIQHTEENMSNGSIDITVYGGMEEYIYDWKDPLNSTSEDQANLAKGYYPLTLKDQLGCSLDTIFHIKDFVNIKEIDGLSSILIYPNPTAGLMNLETTRNLTKIEAFNSIGIRKALEFTRHEDHGYQVRLDDLSTGIYWLLCTDVYQQKFLIKAIKL